MGYYGQAHRIINLVYETLSIAYTIVMGSQMSALFARDARGEIHQKILVSYSFIAFLVMFPAFGL